MSDSREIKERKYRAYLANGYTPYLGWNSNNYTIDGHAKPTIFELPTATTEQVQALKQKLRKQVDIMFARKGKI